MVLSARWVTVCRTPAGAPPRARPARLVSRRL